MADSIDKHECNDNRLKENIIDLKLSKICRWFVFIVCHLPNVFLTSYFTEKVRVLQLECFTYILFHLTSTCTSFLYNSNSKFPFLYSFLLSTRMYSICCLTGARIVLLPSFIQSMTQLFLQELFTECLSYPGNYAKYSGIAEDKMDFVPALMECTIQT